MSRMKDERLTIKPITHTDSIPLHLEMNMKSNSHTIVSYCTSVPWQYVHCFLNQLLKN